jgi:hypothetical protein
MKTYKKFLGEEDTFNGPLSFSRMIAGVSSPTEIINPLKTKRLSKKTSAIKESADTETHEYHNENGEASHITVSKYKNGDTEYMSHLPKKWKTITPFKAIRHSDFKRAEKRLHFFGFTNKKEVVKENLSDTDLVTPPKNKKEKDEIVLIPKSGSNNSVKLIFDPEITHDDAKDINN